MYGNTYPESRLKSRKSIKIVERLEPGLSATRRLSDWNEWDDSQNEAIQRPAEQLPTGIGLQRKDWLSLNRARTKTGKTASTLHKWKLAPSSECICGHPDQTVDHMLTEWPQGPHCTDKDLRDCTDEALDWIKYWRDKI